MSVISWLVLILGVLIIAGGAYFALRPHKDNKPSGGGGSGAGTSSGTGERRPPSSQV